MSSEEEPDTPTLTTPLLLASSSSSSPPPPSNPPATAPTTETPVLLASSSSSSPPPSNSPATVPTTEINSTISEEESQETRLPVKDQEEKVGPTTSTSLSSQPKTFANVFISIVGTGVLGLPYSFKRAGWAMSLLTLFIAAFLTHHCMMLLVHMRRELESQSHAQPEPQKSSDRKQKIKSFHSFGDFAEAVHGNRGRIVMDCVVVIAQAGFCVGYLSFIGDTLTQIIDLHEVTHVGPISKILGWLASKTWYISVCFPFQLRLNSIRSLNSLAPFSIFADMANLGAVAVVFVVDLVMMVKRGGKDIRQLKPYGSVPMFFYGLWVSVYSFEGIAMVLPLEDETRDKERFGRVVGLAMLFIALMYGFFGVFGYFAFGEETKDVITSNLGTGVLSWVVNLGLVINLFVSLPIMMHPVYEVVERHFRGGEVCLWLRWLLVLMMCLVAVLVPNYADILALFANGMCCILGFFVPCWFHLNVFKEQLRPSERLFDVGVMALGILLAGHGFVCSTLSPAWICEQ